MFRKDGKDAKNKDSVFGQRFFLGRRPNAASKTHLPTLLMKRCDFRVVCTAGPGPCLYTCDV